MCADLPVVSTSVHNAHGRGKTITASRDTELCREQKFRAAHHMFRSAILVEEIQHAIVTLMVMRFRFPALG